MVFAAVQAHHSGSNLGAIQGQLLANRSNIPYDLSHGLSD